MRGLLDRAARPQAGLLVALAAAVSLSQVAESTAGPGESAAGAAVAEAAGGPDRPSLPPPSRLKPGALGRDALTGAVEIVAGPRTLRVCPPETSEPDCRYRRLSDALAAAGPGDTVVLAPGLYREGAVVSVPGLVLRGEPGAHLQGQAVEGKAALVVRADGVVIDGIECSKIAVPDRNGACIRVEGDDLTVRNVHFHDNQEGILTGPGGGVLRVEDSLFERNGFGGLAHGVYVNPQVDAFIFRNNRVLETTGAGHGVKSRARRTVIEDSVIAGLDGHDSRAIDIPNGGEVVIRNNVLQKGPNSENAQMIGLALEGPPHDANEALIEGNLFIFDLGLKPWVEAVGDALGLAPAKGRVILSESPGRVVLRDNTIVRAREIGADGGGVVEEGNRTFKSRREAGLPPYPELPATVP